MHCKVLICLHSSLLQFPTLGLIRVNYQCELDGQFPEHSLVIMFVVALIGVNHVMFCEHNLVCLITSYRSTDQDKLPVAPWF